MKCLECGQNYRGAFTCPECGHMPEIVEVAHKAFDSFLCKSEKLRALVTGLMLFEIETRAFDEGGEGHIKCYPWVQLGFSEKDHEKLRKLKRIVETYNSFNKGPAWMIEKQREEALCLVPKKKNLPAKVLQESAEEFGRFLYNVR